MFSGLESWEREERALQLRARPIRDGAREMSEWGGHQLIRNHMQAQNLYSTITNTVEQPIRRESNLTH